MIDAGSRLVIGHVIADHLRTELDNAVAESPRAPMHTELLSRRKVWKDRTPLVNGMLLWIAVLDNRQRCHSTFGLNRLRQDPAECTGGRGQTTKPPLST